MPSIRNIPQYQPVCRKPTMTFSQPQALGMLCFTFVTPRRHFAEVEMESQEGQEMWVKSPNE